MVAVDPHWGQVQVYETPIPLWPTVLEPGWVTRISTDYKTPADQAARPWDQTMRAQAWETRYRAGRPVQGTAVYQPDQV